MSYTYRKATNTKLLYSFAEKIGIPEGAWIRQGLHKEQSLIIKMGNKYKCSFYRIRGSGKYKNTIVLAVGDYYEGKWRADFQTWIKVRLDVEGYPIFQGSAKACKSWTEFLDSESTTLPYKKSPYTNANTH